MRNTNKLNGITRGMNYEAEVLRFMKANEIDNLYLISVDGKRYHGKYGCLIETWYDGSKHWYCEPRKIYKLIKQYYDVNRLEKRFDEYQDDDGYLVINESHFMFDRDYSRVVYVKRDDGTIEINLVRLANGQLYDVQDVYWYSMKNSKNLKQAINNGYQYESVNSWEYDNYESEGTKIQRLEEKATEKIIRSSVDKLLRNQELKEKATAIAEWINNNPEMLEEDKVSDDEAFKKYVYGFTPQHVLFSVKANLFCKWIDSSTKPAYAKILIKNKIEYDYAGRVLKDSKECLNVLRRNFPKLNKIIDERLSNPFCSVTLEKLEKDTEVVSNFDWTAAMARIADELGYSRSSEPWYEIFI